MDNNQYEPYIFRLSADQPPPKKPKRGKWIALALIIIVLFVSALLVFLDFTELLPVSLIRNVAVANSGNESLSNGTEPPIQVSSTRTTTPTSQVTPSITSIPATRAAYYGTVIYTDIVSGYNQLLAISPGDPQPRRLSDGAWNDNEPALSPDGRMLAFRSDRDGYQDLYWMDMETLEYTRLTATQTYEGSPVWSPDNQWLCYEVYENGNFDLWIEAVDGSQLYTLTGHPAMDIDPAWNPAGRQIAFISDRDGNRDIFLANLEDPEQRFKNLTNSPQILESSPVFSADGRYLAYSGYESGIYQIYILDMNHSDAEPVHIGQGRLPAWSPDNRSLAAVLSMPNGEQLVTYAVDSEPIRPLGIPLLQSTGVVWMTGSLSSSLPFLSDSPSTVNQLQVSSALLDSNGRYQLVSIADIDAPTPKLSAAVAGSFNALRAHCLEEAGWDVLATLDYAFVGINDPLPPGFAYDDWLYTGRAVALYDALLPSGWAEIIREDYGLETYWRVYIRTLPQDGSTGEPLMDHPWDFEARFTADPTTYDSGGAIKESIPEGYYLDFTELARAYGFERLPALPNWKRYLDGARYSEFALKNGLDWNAAMLEVYPAQAIITPTPYQTPTRTPTRTPRPTATPWWFY
ncbi:MAG: PD40 domain-containing protein [Anaerolineales bacterium]|nr:PD40 domain-containing protein [Anaerolineales bacterium]